MKKFKFSIFLRIQILLCKRDIFTLFMFICIAQVDFTERILYAFKRKRLEGLMFSFPKKILIPLHFL